LDEVESFGVADESGSCEMVLDAHDAEEPAGQRHHGVPPGLSQVAVTELQAAHAAGDEHLIGLVELERRGVFLDVSGRVLGDDFEDLGVGADVGDEGTK
jgi:hypothetical protein